MGISQDLRDQIETAYDYRGHVTVSLKGGQKIEGYLFNRQFDNPKLAEDNFVEIFLKGGGERKKVSIAQIESVAVTGEDCAAGKSYEDYMRKKAAEKKDAA